MSTPLYALHAVRVSYDGRLALSVDHLEVRQGETLVVVGPNGAGKSTLLRLLNFLEPPAAGEIAFGGQVLTHPVPLELRRRVTTVFQRPALLSRSVWDNVCLGLRIRGREPGRPGGGRDAGDRVQALLQRLDLQDLARARVDSLSGGELQRVALARALAVEPEVLLLDEPTANLDPYNLTVVEGMIQQLQAERTCTLVVVTHNVFQARRLAQRVAMLHGGRLVEVAEAPSFFEHPRDPRAAAFVRGELVA